MPYHCNFSGWLNPSTAVKSRHCLQNILKRSVGIIWSANIFSIWHFLMTRKILAKTILRFSSCRLWILKCIFCLWRMLNFDKRYTLNAHMPCFLKIDEVKTHYSFFHFEAAPHGDRECQQLIGFEETFFRGCFSDLPGVCRKDSIFPGTCMALLEQVSAYCTPDAVLMYNMAKAIELNNLSWRNEIFWIRWV